MIEWNEQSLRDLVRKAGWKRFPSRTPPHRGLYGRYRRDPLLCAVMRLDAAAWVALGYTETDRVSLAQYLGSLGCPARDSKQIPASDIAAICLGSDFTESLAKALAGGGASQALNDLIRQGRTPSPEMVEILVRAGCDPQDALGHAIVHCHPLTPQLAKLLVDAGGIAHDSLYDALDYQQPLSPEIACIFIDAGAEADWIVHRAVQLQSVFLTADLVKTLVRKTGCDPAALDSDGYDALTHLALGLHEVSPEVTDLLLQAGCRTDLQGIVEGRTTIRLLLQEHARWKAGQDVAVENTPPDSAVDWDR